MKSLYVDFCCEVALNNDGNRYRCLHRSLDSFCTQYVSEWFSISTRVQQLAEHARGAFYGHAKIVKTKNCLHVVDTGGLKVKANIFCKFSTIFQGAVQVDFPEKHGRPQKFFQRGAKSPTL